MYLSMLRMSCHALGLLLATILCWNLCQGEMKFYSDDVTCSQNGTTKLASRQKTVSAIFCVKLGSTDVLNNDVYITQPSQPYSRDFWYRLNNTDRRLQVSSLTKASYTTINITFTKLESRDFNETFFVSIYQVDSSLKEKVKVWFNLKEETAEGADNKTTSITQTTSDNNEATTGATSVPSSGSNSSIPQEMLNYMYIAIAVVIVLILAVIIAVLIHRYRGRITKSSRAISDADDLNAYAEIRNVTINPGNEDDGKADKSLKETRDRESRRGDNSVDHLMSAHVDDKVMDTGRNISEQGLVYVTVVQATKQDKKKSEKASDKKKKPQETKQSPVVESVEYTTLDLEKSGKFKSADSNVYLNQ